MKRAYSYIRFSRLHQADGDSDRRQRKATEDYCQKHGLQLDDSLRLFDKGVSAFRGRNAEKGALGKFIAACESGLVPRGSALIVESLDRLSRQSPRKTVRLLTELLDDHGIEVHLTMAGKVFKPESEDGVDLIFAVALAMRAHEESETKSRRLEEAFAAKRAAAMKGEKILAPSVPWWLTLQDGKITSPPERAAIVRRIFEETAAGRSSNAIAWALNAENVPTFRPKAKIWQDARIREMIQSDAPLGTLTQTRKTAVAGKTWRIPGYYPQVISEELALEARSRMHGNRRAGRPNLSTSPANLLKGLARFQGIWMRFSIHRRGTNWNGYYEALWPDKAGIAFMVPANHLEPILLTALSELQPAALSPEATEELASIRLRAALGKLEEKIENISRAVESGSITLANRLVELEKEHQATQAALATAEAEEKTAGADPEALKDVRRFSLTDLKDIKKRGEIAAVLKRLVCRIDVGSSIADLPQSTEKPTVNAAELGKLEVSSFPDPTGSRGKKPLVLLITFHGGGKRLIFREADGMPSGIGSARY